jgi:hypothetical protein
MNPRRTTNRHLIRRWLLALSAVGIVLGIVVPGPAGATRLPDLQCGVNPTTDVRLRHDLTCEQGFRGGTDAPRVNIDLGGHKLEVINGTCSTFGPCGAVFDEASVTNGTVVGDLKDVRLVRRVRITGNVYLGETAGPASTLEHSVVRTGRVAVLSPDTTVTKNLLLGSGPLGGGVTFIDSLRNLTDEQITGNHIVGAGITVFDSCASCPDDVSGVIAGNIVTGSPGAGIDVSGQLPSLGRIDIRQNLVLFSGGDGIHVGPSPAPPEFGGGPIVLTRNRLIFNRGHGINSEWITTDPTLGVVDGGGNHAVRNGLQPGCIGVSCSLW